MTETNNRNEEKKEDLTLQWVQSYSPVPVKVGDGTGFLMMDNNGFVMTKEKFLRFMEQATRAYESPDIEDWIHFHNFKEEFPLFLTEQVDGKYILPPPNYNRRTFRKDLKRDWGFKCAWCENKVSSKTDEVYFESNADLDDYGMRTVTGRYCQEACAENYWYETVIQLVMDKKVTSYIHTDKRVSTETP